MWTRCQEKAFCVRHTTTWCINWEKGISCVLKVLTGLGGILEEWRKIVKEKEANITVIDMPLLNTASVNGDLTGTFVADLVLQILAYVAETEHSFIKSRQAEGIALARKNGVQFGRRRLEVTNKFEKMFEEWENGRISARAAAENLQISYSTFYRRCKEYEKKLEKNG